MVATLFHVLYLLSAWAGTTYLHSTLWERNDELSNILKQEVIELTRDLTTVESMTAFIACVSELSLYGDFTEPSLPHVIDLLEQNKFAPESNSFEGENFRLVFVRYFTVIGPPALTPLMKIVKNTELLTETRELASESIRQIAQTAGVKSTDTATEIENILMSEWDRSGNSLICTRLLNSYGYIAENSEASQIFLIELLERDDISVKIPAIEAACESQRGSARILLALAQEFQKCNKPETRRGSPLLYTIIDSYGKLGLFDESIDAFLKLEIETNDDPIWRIMCAESLARTRTDSATFRHRTLSELQHEMSIRPVSPNGCIVVNKALHVLHTWDPQHLIEAEQLLIEVVQEPSVDSLRAFAFELLLKMQSTSVHRLVEGFSESTCDGLRLEGIFYRSKNSEIDMDDLRFLSELLSDEYAADSLRLECIRIFATAESKALVFQDQLEKLWQGPGPAEIRIHSLAAYNKIRSSTTKPLPKDP